MAGRVGVDFSRREEFDCVELLPSSGVIAGSASALTICDKMKVVSLASDKRPRALPAQKSG
jgi:hypothetical protein